MIGTLHGTRTWTFDLPQARPLSLNDRMHRYARAAAVAEYRAAAKSMARYMQIPNCERVRVTLVYEPRDARRRDPLNLVATLKAVQDGLVDARVVADDTVEFMESPMPLIDLPCGGKRGRLTVIVERLA